MKRAGECVALHRGDAVDVLATEISACSVDMIYSDPPFGTGRLWSGSAGSFDDRWTMDAGASALLAALEAARPGLGEVLAAITPDGERRALLVRIGAIMLEARRVLRATGTFWLHFDDTLGAEFRVIGDAIFGPVNALGSIVWKRTSAHSNAQSFGRVHDTIACWGARPARQRLARCGRSGGLVHGDPLGEFSVDAVLLDDSLNARSSERVGYPTQKPVSLIERFVSAATLPGDVVLDPTCGSGTTLVAALNLGRRAIGIDISEDAIRCAKARVVARAPRQLDLFAA